jgi:hypothetical protein
MEVKQIHITGVSESSGEKNGKPWRRKDVYFDGGNDNKHGCFLMKYNGEWWDSVVGGATIFAKIEVSQNGEYTNYNIFKPTAQDMANVQPNAPSSPEPTQSLGDIADEAQQPQRTPSQTPPQYQPPLPDSYSKDEKIRWMNSINNACNLIRTLTVIHEVKHNVLALANWLYTTVPGQQYNEVALTTAQNKKLHSLQKDCKASDDQYHDVLTAITGNVVYSTLDLTKQQASHCIKLFAGTFNKESGEPPQTDTGGIPEDKVHNVMSLLKSKT